LKPERADKVLADRGLVASRSQAKSLIEKGDVLCEGKILKKAGELISPEAKLEVTSPLFVGRGAFKLEKALEVFQVSIQDQIILDIGASTGGFTQILLHEGAQRVYAIDVGHNQLASKLRTDSRVINMEGINVRDLNSLPELADGAVMDLSFISITKVLENVARLLKPNGFLIALVKPQFEAGKERLPKDGVIKDPKVQEAILQEVITYAELNKWHHRQSTPSPIEGKSGNKEFLSYFTKTL
jgi:23S rRNA (cytidine1920-2'-O)/16S rRNA (cytidine1409-2'-O)-methyltransferase